MDRQFSISAWRFAGFVVLSAVIGAVASWALQRYNPAVHDRAVIEKVVQEYLLEHPEILPKAIDNLQAKEAAKQLEGIQAEVEKPYPGMVLGNPAGKVTLVEFIDYACTYCRLSVADVDQLLQDNPDLKVVIRQLPILSPASAEAAKLGLAAAAQGKYAAFHHAVFQAGQLNKVTMEAAARAAGLDMARVKQDIAAPAVAAEIEQNMEFAHTLRFQGTPSWVIGTQVHNGAVDKAVLEKAIAKARS